LFDSNGRAEFELSRRGVSLNRIAGENRTLLSRLGSLAQTKFRISKYFKPFWAIEAVFSGVLVFFIPLGGITTGELSFI